VCPGRTTKTCVKPKRPVFLTACHHKTLLFGPDTHGACHVRKETCCPYCSRVVKIHFKAIHVLCAANAFQFTQSFCLRNFADTLPMHRLSSTRRLRVYMHLECHPALNARTRGDWEDIWKFFPHTLSGLTLLRVDIGIDRPVLRRIANESKDEAERLLVVRTMGTARDRGVHGSGQAVEQKRRLLRTRPT
jgi:hypothetical protein